MKTLTHGFSNQSTIVICTTPNILNYMEPVKDGIRNCLLPAITGKSAISDSERNLFSLPGQLGGLSVSIPTTITTLDYSVFCKFTGLLVDDIALQRKCSSMTL